MSMRGKVRSKRISGLGIIAIVFLITLHVNAKHKVVSAFLYSYSTLIDSPPASSRNKVVDTPPAKRITGAIKDTTHTSDSTAINDSLPADSMVQVIDTFNVKISKDSLTAPVSYAAEDSGI